MAAATSLQMHLQHSPRKKNFGYEETIRLLELWTHYTNGGTHPELGKGHRTGRLWLVISERMKAMNYNRGPEECKVRVGNLRAKYTKLKRGYLSGEDLASLNSCDFFPPSRHLYAAPPVLATPYTESLVHDSFVSASHSFSLPTSSYPKFSVHMDSTIHSLSVTAILKCCLRQITNARPEQRVTV